MIGEVWQNFVSETAAWSAHAVFLRLLLATLVGVAIGIDREFRNKGAGVKTHVLVCIGAAMAMIVSEYVLHQFPYANGDINRIGAQVISGVGFLGVGTILVTGKKRGPWPHHGGRSLGVCVHWPCRGHRLCGGRAYRPLLCAAHLRGAQPP